MTMCASSRLPKGRPLRLRHADAVARACRLIENSEMQPALETLARAVGMSPFHFHRIFKKITGVTPKAYAAARRAGAARNILPKSSSVTEAIYEAGFQSSGRFYAQAARTLGLPPATYRRGGPGATIRFAVGECSLGSILVAASEKGVCAIFLGPDPNVLTQDLQQRFPKAELIGGDQDFEQVVARVVGLVEDPHAAIDLPLDIRGTIFQQKVWQALVTIPPGSTVSYADLARQIGLPKAVRAVASACAANALAVVIPCHRVVRMNGGLSGYRWGVDLKRSLLAREKSSVRQLDGTMNT